MLRVAFCGTNHLTSDTTALPTGEHCRMGTVQVFWWAQLGLFILHVWTITGTVTTTSTKGAITTYMFATTLALAPTVSHVRVQGLITEVWTVTSSITHLVRRNTEVGQAGTGHMVRLGTVATARLVTPVGTVRYVITEPELKQAQAPILAQPVILQGGAVLAGLR